MSKIYTFMLILCLSTTVSDALLGVATSAVISAAKLIASVAPTHRQCNIVIRNRCTSHSLQNPRMYMVSGSGYVPMPRDIGTNRQTNLEFRKTPHTARGAVGVFTYNLFNTKTNRVDRKLAFMFSVPYNFMFHSNWFAAGFFPQWKACNYNLYREMYYWRQNRFVRRKAPRHITHRDGRFTVKATMTNTYTPKMTVDIYDGWVRG